MRLPRRPVVKCKSNRVLCPDPLCRHVQGQQFVNTRHGKFRGRAVSYCDRCAQSYFVHCADGGAEVVGLWPGEEDTIDIDRPLTEIWEALGMLAEVA